MSFINETPNMGFDSRSLAIEVAFSALGVTEVYPVSLLCAVSESRLPTGFHCGSSPRCLDGTMLLLFPSVQLSGYVECAQ